MLEPFVSLFERRGVKLMKGVREESGGGLVFVQCFSMVPIFSADRQRSLVGNFLMKELK